MLKTLKNEMNKEKKITSTKLEKPKQPLMIKKPLIYYKVEEQKIREKIENEFIQKRLILLKKKYFNKIKFFYKYSALVKKRRIKILTISFYNLKKATYLMRNKNQEIIRYYKNLFKLKYIYAWAKQTKISINEKVLIMSFRNATIFKFIQKVLRSKCLKKDFLEKTKYCYAKLFYFKLNKVVESKYNKQLIRKKFNTSIRLYVYKILVGKIVKKLCYFEKYYQIVKSYCYKLFLSKIKKTVYSKNIKKIVVETNKKRIYFNSFKKSFHEFRALAIKQTVSKNFHSDFMKLAFFKRMSLIHDRMHNFKNIVKTLYSYYKKVRKSAFINRYNETREKKREIRLKYKALKYNYTSKSIVDFFNKIKVRINNKKKRFVASNFYSEKLLFITFSKMKFFLQRQSKFKLFTSNFKKVMENSIKKGYLQIMLHKSHLFIRGEENVFYEKYRETVLHKKIRKYMISSISNVFFKNLKYIKKKFIKKQKKNSILKSYYHRKLIINCFGALVNYRKYKLVKLRNQFIVKENMINLLYKFKFVKDNTLHIKTRNRVLLFNKYLCDTAISLILKRINLNNQLFNVRSFSMLKNTFFKVLSSEKRNTLIRSKIGLSCIFMLILMNTYISKIHITFSKIKTKHSLNELENKIKNYYMKMMLSTMFILRETKNKYRLKLDQIKRLVITRNTSNESNSSDKK